MNTKLLYDITYASGDIFLPTKVRNILDIDLVGSSEKTFYIDGWSIMHLLCGVLIGFLYLYYKGNTNFYFIRLLLLHTIWELWQTLIGMAKPYKLTGSNNLIDSIVDTILFMLGAYIIRIIMNL
jgi:hypothetical protein